MTGRALLLAAVVAVFSLAGPVGCGKRGALEAPAGKPSTYPQSYPAN